MVHDSFRCRYSPYRSRHGSEHTIGFLCRTDGSSGTTIDQLETTVWDSGPMGAQSMLLDILESIQIGNHGLLVPTNLWLAFDWLDSDLFQGSNWPLFLQISILQGAIAVNGLELHDSFCCCSWGWLGDEATSESFASVRLHHQTHFAAGMEFDCFENQYILGCTAFHVLPEFFNLDISRLVSRKQEHQRLNIVTIYNVYDWIMCSLSNGLALKSSWKVCLSSWTQEAKSSSCRWSAQDDAVDAGCNFSPQFLKAIPVQNKLP